MYTIKSNEFDHAYKIMEAAFPNSELRTYAKIKEFFIREELRLFGIKEENTLSGVIMCWECDTCIFLENFAVDKAARGKGLGSLLLKEIQNYYIDKLIILEIEKPYDDLSERRLHFYERNGFILSDYGYMQPQINVEVNTIYLMIMSYPKSIDQEQFIAIKDDLFRNVYQK